MTINNTPEEQSTFHLTVDAEDFDLARRAANGDESATKKWVELMSPQLLRTATLILQDPFLAEDAVQDALIAALQSIDMFDGTGSVRAWVLKILVNRCYSY